MVQRQRTQRVHSDLDAMTGRMNSCRNCDATLHRKAGPSLLEEVAPIRNTYMCRGEQKSWPWFSRRPEARNDCAGEGQQQSFRLTDRQSTPTQSHIVLACFILWSYICLLKLSCKAREKSTLLLCCWHGSIWNNYNKTECDTNHTLHFKGKIVPVLN
jgi:hypothetical protein